MERDILIMSQKERTRYHLLRMVVEGRVTLKEAGYKLGLSYRQAKRVKKRFVEEGARGLVHGRRGRSSPQGLESGLKERILELSCTRYEKFNDTHFTQKLREEEDIKVSRETVRRLRRSAGIKPKRKRRPKKHHRRRPRKPQEGMMVLWDGSPHPWFGLETKPCCLLSAVDDATSRLLWALFIEYEGSHGYLLLLKEMVSRYGLPLSIYHDRHGSLCRNDDHWTLEEQLAGQQEPTQVGQALKELGITAIPALSPQAKGRVERLFGVLQDRLVAEMDLLGIKDLQQGNRFLHQTFIDDYNRRFALPPENTQPAWRKLPPDLDLDQIISFRYQAVVLNDNTVRLGGLVIDIPQGPRQRGYAKAKVQVRQLLDGSWRVYHHDQLIAQHQATPLKEPIKARRRKKNRTKAAHEVTWVYLQSPPQTPQTLVLETG